MPRLSYSSLSLPEPEKNGIGWKEDTRAVQWWSCRVGEREVGEGRKEEWKDSGEVVES